MAFLCPEISKTEKTSFSSRYYWHFSNFEIKIPQKCFFGIFYPSLKIFQNEPLKIEKKSSTVRKFYFDLGPKRYLGRRDPIIVSMGSKLKVQGMDS